MEYFISGLWVAEWVDTRQYQNCPHDHAFFKWITFLNLINLLSKFCYILFFGWHQNGVEFESSVIQVTILFKILSKSKVKRSDSLFSPVLTIRSLYIEPSSLKAADMLSVICSQCGIPCKERLIKFASIYMLLLFRKSGAWTKIK